MARRTGQALEQHRTATAVALLCRLTDQLPDNHLAVLRRLARGTQRVVEDREQFAVRVTCREQRLQQQPSHLGFQRARFQGIGQRGGASGLLHKRRQCRFGVRRCQVTRAKQLGRTPCRQFRVDQRKCPDGRGPQGKWVRCPGGRLEHLPSTGNL